MGTVDKMLQQHSSNSAATHVINFQTAPTLLACQLVPTEPQMGQLFQLPKFGWNRSCIMQQAKWTAQLNDGIMVQNVKKKVECKKKKQTR